MWCRIASDRSTSASVAVGPCEPSVGGLRLLGEGLGAAALYSLMTILLLQPLLADPAGSLFDGRAVAKGSHGDLALKDVLLLAWIYAWDWHALVTDPLRIFDANAFHPYPTSLAFSEAAFGKLLTAGVVFGLTGNAVLAHQTDLLLTFSLSAAAVYALLRSMSVSVGAGLLAGAVFAFCPVRLETLHHSHLLGWQYLPVSLLFLDRTLRTGRAKDAAGFALLLLLQCLCSYYLAYMALVAVGAFAASYLLVGRRAVSIRGIFVAAVAGVAALLCLGLLSWPYLELRSIGVLPRYDLADPGGALVLRHSSNDPWRTYLDPSAPVPYGTASPFVGWAPLGASFIACVAAVFAKDVVRRTRIVAGTAIVVVAWALSLGPYTGVAGGLLTSPYEMFARLIPGFSSMRAPGRFALLMMLGVGMLVGFGLDAIRREILRRRFRRSAAICVAVAFGIVVALEYRLVSRTFPAYSIDIEASGNTVNAVLAGRQPGVVAEFPFHGEVGIEAATAMLNSTTHWHEIVNGKSGYEPKGRNLVRIVAGRMPEDAAALPAFVRLTGARYIVVRNRASGPSKVDAWSKMPGIRWLHRDAEGDLLGRVEIAQQADLVPPLLACAGYREAEHGHEDPCDALSRRLATSGHAGTRP